MKTSKYEPIAWMAEWYHRDDPDGLGGCGMTNSDTPGPCPFCGTSATAEFYEDGGWCVACDDPNCAIMDDTYETEAEAIAAWNRRATPPDSEVENES